MGFASGGVGVAHDAAAIAGDEGRELGGGGITLVAPKPEDLALLVEHGARKHAGAAVPIEDRLREVAIAGRRRCPNLGFGVVVDGEEDVHHRTGVRCPRPRLRSIGRVSGGACHIRAADEFAERVVHALVMGARVFVFRDVSAAVGLVHFVRPVQQRPLELGNRLGVAASSELVAAGHLVASEEDSPIAALAFVAGFGGVFAALEPLVGDLGCVVGG